MEYEGVAEDGRSDEVAEGLVGGVRCEVESAVLGCLGKCQ